MEKNEWRNITSTSNVFCASIAPTHDGKLLVSGGHSAVREKTERNRLFARRSVIRQLLNTQIYLQNNDGPILLGQWHQNPTPVPFCRPS
jgi:hypothetical protein